MLKVGDVLWRMQGIAQNDMIRWTASPMAVEVVYENRCRTSNDKLVSFSMIGKQVFRSREECLKAFLQTHDSFEEKIISPLPKNVIQKPRTDYETYRIYRSYTMEQIIYIYCNGEHIKESELVWDAKKSKYTGEIIYSMQLQQLSKQLFKKYGSCVITVVVENALSGEIFQIGNHKEKKWVKHGSTTGYA